VRAASRCPLIAALAVAGWTIASAQQAARPQSHPDLEAMRDAGKLSEPTARVAALEQVEAKFPDSLYLVDVYAQEIAALQAMTPVDLAAVDAAVAKARTVHTPRTPHEVLNLLAMTLMKSPTTLARAEALSHEAIAVLNDSQRATPSDRYAGTLSLYELYLGRIFLEEHRDADATAAFERSLDASPLQGSAALALANLAEQAGDFAEMYRRLSWTAITGRLQPSDRSRLEMAYAKTHPDAKPGDVDYDLDRLFRESFKNPVTPERYTPGPSRTDRVVLAEIFSGAGCVPCLSADLSFEAMLDRYTRSEFVVLFDHIHAPTPDPLSNRSVQARAGFYGVNAAPTIFIDGVKVEGEGAREETPKTFPILDRAVGAELNTASGASIQLRAGRTGAIVSADVDVAGWRSDAADLRLQVALVETLVRYSGENGQRFHPMVTRAFAGDRFNGFALDASRDATTAHATFDLGALAADTLTYYADYAADMKARTGLVVSFREEKQAIDPANVAIVAFVQNVKTHAVLQTAWAAPAVR